MTVVHIGSAASGSSVETYGGEGGHVQAQIAQHPRDETVGALPFTGWDLLVVALFIAVVLVLVGLLLSCAVGKASRED